MIRNLNKAIFVPYLYVVVNDRFNYYFSLRG